MNRTANSFSRFCVGVKNPKCSKFEIDSFTRSIRTPSFSAIAFVRSFGSTIEVINQLLINTDNSHHRYNVMLLINGIPAVQIELKTLQINPLRGIEQIVDDSTDSDNDSSKA